MSWHYSQALVAEYSAANCSDGEPFAPLNLNPLPQAFLCEDRMKAYSKLSRYGMTFAPLTESHGEAVLMWYLAGFPAKTLAAPVKAQASMESAAACGEKWRASLAKYDPSTHSLKTAQCSLLEDSTECSVTLPKWGLMLAGELYQQPMLVQSTSVKEFGLLPTPTASAMGSNTSMRKRGVTAKDLYMQYATPTTMDSLPPKSATALAREATVARPGRSKPANLRDQICNEKNWPTPQSRDYKGSSGRSMKGEECDLPTAVQTYPTPRSCSAMAANLTEQMAAHPHNNLEVVIAREKYPTPTCRDYKDGKEPRVRDGVIQQDTLGRVVNTSDGALNPDWVEWLMGWPVGWTRLDGEPEACDVMQIGSSDYWQVDPADSGVAPRVANGVVGRVPRLKAIGNGQVPLCAAVAFMLLSEIFEQRKKAAA